MVHGNSFASDTDLMTWIVALVGNVLGIFGHVHSSVLVDWPLLCSLRCCARPQIRTLSIKVVENVIIFQLSANIMSFFCSLSIKLICSSKVVITVFVTAYNLSCAFVAPFPHYYLLMCSSSLYQLLKTYSESPYATMAYNGNTFKTSYSKCLYNDIIFSLYLLSP